MRRRLALPAFVFVVLASSAFAAVPVPSRLCVFPASSLLASAFYTLEERDYLIRTIAFEALYESEAGKAAVAYVVLNRKKSSKWRGNIKEIVTQPGQFEPWSANRKELEALSPDDPRYQAAALIADAVLTGSIPDPTEGATHFLNPKVVRHRRGGSLPSWAKGESLVIGNNAFYAPYNSDYAPRKSGMYLIAFMSQTPCRG